MESGTFGDMKNDDVSEGSRELVDLSAEAVSSLGFHLAQVGQIISRSQLPPQKGDRSSAFKLKTQLEMYQGYTDEVQRRRNELEQKMAEDFARLKAWRAQSGTEGKGLVEELEALYGKVRQQDKEIKKKQAQIEEEQAKVEELKEAVALRERKWDSLAKDYSFKLVAMRQEIVQRGSLCSWLQCAFDEIRFKWKAAEEKEKLKIEHHQRMRKARAQSRLEVISRERQRRLLQACMLSLQEETVEGRQAKHLAELRRRHEDEVLVFNAQLAQALGDEEKAKELVAEQTRRIEEARRLQDEAERSMKIAQREAREAHQEKEKALRQRDAAEEARRAAEEERDAAFRAKEAAEASEAYAKEQAEVFQQARLKAEARQRKAEEQVRKKQKKIQSLQRMLAEIGAESDSDAPPDERAPAFFVNEDGTKVPRARTRKERMGMAYREAESARYELRIGMAAMLDRDSTNEVRIERLKDQVASLFREVQVVRSSNESLKMENAQAFDRAERAEEEAKQARVALADGVAAKQMQMTDSTQYMDSQALTIEPMNSGPLAASSAEAPPWSPNRPSFSPAEGEAGTPRLLTKTQSTPIFMPPLAALTGSASSQTSSTPGVLAPLRRVRRPTNWRSSWH